MKKTLLYLLVLLMSVSIIGCSGIQSNGAEQRDTAAHTYTPQQSTSQIADGNHQDSAQTTDVLTNVDGNTASQTSLTNAGTAESSETADETAVRSLVEEFGKRLQLVSLLAPKELLDASMKENYSGLVSPELIAQWREDPQKAPGRAVSSPWPDRIEISAIIKSQENSPGDIYNVKGEVIEITSVEKENGGAAAKRPVTLTAAKSGDRWQIVSVTLGEYEAKDRITYENTQYGFKFSLPASWKGYTIISDKWEGMAVDDNGGRMAATGPVISIRHPEWTSKNPRQDIPIMVFTPDQWNALQKDEFHIGAAPIGPCELGRNSEYVFALPARYNFAFPEGYEEVEKILDGNPLKPQEPSGR